jgi:hypothetical protein
MERDNTVGYKDDLAVEFFEFDCDGVLVVREANSLKLANSVGRHSNRHERNTMS